MIHQMIAVKNCDSAAADCWPLANTTAFVEIIPSSSALFLVNLKTTLTLLPFADNQQPTCTY